MSYDINDYLDDCAEFDGPEAGDYIISDNGLLHGGTLISKYFGRWNKQLYEYSEAYDIIKNEMEREKFWSNVWTLSDHGNYNLISLEELEERGA